MKEKTKTEGYLFDNRALRALIIPLLLEQLLNVAVGMADSVMVASVGEAAVSGVSLVDNVFILLIQVLTALGTGGAVIIGQYLGSRDSSGARKAAGQLIVFLLCFSLVIMGLVYLGQGFILRGVFGAIADDVYGHARTYLVICAASIPGIALYSGAAAVYRVQGDSRTPMRVALMMNAINVTGNAILIYGCHFGTAGVAIPTLVSRSAAAVAGMVLLTRRDKEVYVRPSARFRFDGGMIKRIMGIAVPNGVENSLFQIGKLVVLNLITTFGTTAIAANAVSMDIANFAILPGVSIGYAMVTVISQCVGAGDEAQTRYYTRKLMFIAYAAMWGINVLIFIFMPQIIGLYHLSAGTAHTAALITATHSGMAMVIWPIAFTLPNNFRAKGNALFPMVVSIASMVFVRILFCYIFAVGFGLGVWGTWIAMILDWVVRTVAFIIYYFKGNKMHQSILPTRE